MSNNFCLGNVVHHWVLGLPESPSPHNIYFVLSGEGILMYVTDKFGNPELVNEETVISSHNFLEGLQGGEPGQYYHLTLEQYSKVIEVLELDIVSSVTGANVDNTDPNNPIILVPNAQQVFEEGSEVFLSNGSIELKIGDYGNDYSAEVVINSDGSSQSTGIFSIYGMSNNAKGFTLDSADSDGIKVQDDIHNKGLYYGNEYIFTNPRQIPDLGYIESQLEGYVKEVIGYGVDITDPQKPIIRNVPVINVKHYGATGNGVTDDTVAIKAALLAAKTGDIKSVYFPKGIYMISQTLYLSSNMEILGDGMNISIIRCMPSAANTLDLISLVTGSLIAQYKYRTMMATEGSSYTIHTQTDNLKIHDIGIDWNGTACGTNSAIPLLMGVTRYSEVYRVRFFDALPSNLDNTNTSNHGSCYLFAFAEDCKIYNCLVGASDYESGSYGYLSDKIYTYNNVFDIQKPSTFRYQAHALQAASVASVNLQTVYGRYRTGSMYIDNNVFLIKNNLANTTTSHTVDGMYLRGNHYVWYANQLTVGSKVFDDTNYFEITGNTYYAVAGGTNGFPVSGTTNATAQGWAPILLGTPVFDEDHTPIMNGVVSGNKIFQKNTVAYTGDVASIISAYIGTHQISASNIVIANNVIEIDGYDNYPKSIFGIYGNGYLVTGNTIKLSNPLTTITDAGFRLAYIIEGKSIDISNNSAIGTAIGKGIVIENGDLENITLGINKYENIIGSKLTSGLTDQIEIRSAVYSVKGKTADTDNDLDGGIITLDDSSPQVVGKVWYGTLAQFQALGVTDSEIEYNIEATLPVIDSIPTDGSNNAVSSNGVFDSLALKANINTPTFTTNITTPAATISTSPTASAGGYEILTRNTTTGIVEKVTLATVQSAPANAMVFTPTATPTYTAGKVEYDSNTESLIFYNNDNQVALNIGQEAWIRVRNDSGSTIPNGSAVYISGTHASGLPQISLAQANSASTTIVAGLVTENIANNSIGYVTSLGVVNNLNTSSFTAGASIFLSATTPGALTTTAPTAPNYRYRIGLVTKSNATTGTIHVTPTTASLGNGTANQLFGIDNAGTAQEVKSIVGTTGALSVTHSANTITLNTAFLSGSAILDFPSTAPQTASDLTITVTGAALGDCVSLGIPNASIIANTSYNAWVSSANTVTVRHVNAGSVASNPASGTFNIKVIK